MTDAAPESPLPEPQPAEVTEDERRSRAAELNRKRAEEEWNRNKREWLAANFPERASAEKK
jgi:hypothetical protein